MREATADRGHLFAAPVTLATDARADTAIAGRSGALVLGMVRKAGQPELNSGVLSLFRSLGAEDPITPDATSGPLLGDAAGDTVLAWRTPDALNVATTAP